MTAAPPASRFRLAAPGTALVLGGLLLVMLVLALILGAVTHQLRASSSGLIATVVAFGAVGVVVGYHQPRNPMGWLMMGTSGSFMLDALSGTYETLYHSMHRGTVLLFRAAEFLHPAWAPAALLGGLAVLLFPDGRLPSSRWRPLLWAYLAVGAVWLVGAYYLTAHAILTHTDHLVVNNGDLSVVDHPTGSAAWWGAVQSVFFPLLGVSWLAWLGGQVVSFRRSTGERRVQLKWLISGAAICVIGAIAGVVLQNSQSAILRAVGAAGIAALLALPVSIGIGILKFRLYEIDRIISRTLAYAIVTGLLVGAYAGIVVVGAGVASPSPVVVAACTLAAAAVFSPLRRRVQRVVDRRFNRARYDADRTIAAFAARLQDSVDPGAVREDLTGVVQRSLEPAHVSVWLTGGHA